jgi:hypothetical protein
VSDDLLGRHPDPGRPSHNSRDQPIEEYDTLPAPTLLLPVCPRIDSGRKGLMSFRIWVENATLPRTQRPTNRFGQYVSRRLFANGP